MKLVSTYGTNKLDMDHPAKKTYVKDGEKITKDVHFPELVLNHFKYRYTVHDYNPT